MNCHIRTVLFIEVMVAILACPLSVAAFCMPSDHSFGAYILGTGIALCVVMLLLVGAIIWFALERALTVGGVL